MDRRDVRRWIGAALVLSAACGRGPAERAESRPESRAATPTARPAATYPGPRFPSYLKPPSTLDEVMPYVRPIARNKTGFQGGGLGLAEPGETVLIVASDEGEPLILDAVVKAMEERGVHVVLCPRSNQAIGVGQADVPALEAAGVKLALGSDSLASAPSLDVLEDAALLHRQFPALAPRSILRMATLGGASALGLHELGAIEPGRRAALAYARAGADPGDPEAFLLSGEARLTRVALGGAGSASA